MPQQPNTKIEFKVTVEISPRIFCFYSLLNAGGYDPEFDVVHPVRKYVRDFLAKTLPGPIRDDIHAFIALRGIDKEIWHPLRIWTLCHSQPPHFNELSGQWRASLEKDNAIKFEQLMNLLWGRYEISRVWKEVKGNYEAVSNQVLGDARRAASSTLNYLRINKDQLLFNEFVVIPNFLEELTRGLGPRIDKTAYAILGPSKTPNDSFKITIIEHEFLHSIINPLTAEIFQDIGGRNLSAIRENLIHGLVLRINFSDLDYVRRKMQILETNGFKTEKVLRLLVAFENSGEDIEFFLTNNAQKLKEACLS